MIFRNLTLYRFPLSITAKLSDALATSLAEQPLREPGPLEMSTRGFVSPYGADSDELVHEMQNFRLIALGGWDKILPSSVVNAQLAARVKALAEREGRRVGARERKRLKDEVLTDLLPKAFARACKTFAYLDLASGWFVVDTASRKAADEFAVAVREALGTFPCVPMAPEESPRACMTQWLAEANLPRGYQFGDEGELCDPVETGAVVRVRRQDMETDEVREHLRCGKQVFQLGLTFDDRCSFVLSEDLHVRKFRLLDVVMEELGEQDDARSELQASFALMALELKSLLGNLAVIFGIAEAQS